MIAALMAMLVAVIGGSPHVSWKDGEGCAYFPGLIGNYAYDGFTVTDIREILDGHNRTIGVVYVSDDGRYAMQGNPFMHDSEVASYRLSRSSGVPFFTTIVPVDLHTIHQPVVECRRDHMMKAWRSVILVEDVAERAYRTGRSHISDSRVDLHP